MADVYEKDLAQKTSLTTSDFLRVVGSDNASYKQPVSNVMTIMGIDRLAGVASATFTGDANTLVDTGIYQIGNPANVTNLPSGVGYGILLVDKARGYIVQTYIDLNANNKFIRWSTNTGTSWVDWRSDGSITSMGLPLTSGTDLNTLTTFGIYYYHNPVSDLVNAPSDAGSYAMLYVVPRATSSKYDQILLSNKGTYYRVQTNATQWSNWMILGELPSTFSYTPTIVANNGDATFAVANISATCVKCGSLLQVNGRFQITNTGTTNSIIKISLPTNVDVFDSGVGGCGTVTVDTTAQFSIRSLSNSLLISKGGGGNYSLPAIGTGYVAFTATLVLK